MIGPTRRLTNDPQLLTYCDYKLIHYVLHLSFGMVTRNDKPGREPAKNRLCLWERIQLRLSMLLGDISSDMICGDIAGIMTTRIQTMENRRVLFN